MPIALKFLDRWFQVFWNVGTSFRVAIGIIGGLYVDGNRVFEAIAIGATVDLWDWENIAVEWAKFVRK